MTAKEALRERIDDLTEREAERILVQVEAQLAARPKEGSPGGTVEELHDWIQALFSDVPPEAWENVPAARDVDNHLYGHPH